MLAPGNFEEAFANFKRATADLNAFWQEGVPGDVFGDSYPRYLPSFDEFSADVQMMVPGAMLERPTFDYEGACRRATIDQGLERFDASPDWMVEQTGGFTMVAVRHYEDGTTWTVTRNGTTPGKPYFAVRLTTEKWREGDDGEGYLAVFDVSLEDALALGE